MLDYVPRKMIDSASEYFARSDDHEIRQRDYLYGSRDIELLLYLLFICLVPVYAYNLAFAQNFILCFLFVFLTTLLLLNTMLYRMRDLFRKSFIKILDYLITITAFAAVAALFDLQSEYYGTISTQNLQSALQLRDEVLALDEKLCFLTLHQSAGPQAQKTTNKCTVGSRDFELSTDCSEARTINRAKSACQTIKFAKKYDILEYNAAYYLSATQWIVVLPIRFWRSDDEDAEHSEVFYPAYRLTEIVEKSAQSMGSVNQYKLLSQEKLDYRIKLIGFIIIAFGLALRFAKTTAEILEWHKK